MRWLKHRLTYKVWLVEIANGGAVQRECRSKGNESFLRGASCWSAVRVILQWNSCVWNTHVLKKGGYELFVWAVVWMCLLVYFLSPSQEKIHLVEMLFLQCWSQEQWPQHGFGENVLKATIPNLIWPSYCGTAWTACCCAVLRSWSFLASLSPFTNREWMHRMSAERQMPSC